MNQLETILKDIENVKVIDSSIPLTEYVSLDLSVSNSELSKLDLSNALTFQMYIDHYLNKSKAKVAFGGYSEERNLYKRSTAFNDNNSEERNIHIALDLWIKAGTPVLAALDGTVHSFKYNDKLGDYGPTIILKHQIDTENFYTLYGHLSLESIKNTTIGQFYKKGELLGSLGDPSVNGDYAPHLHFQIIKDIKDNFGDYPGVCSRNNLNFYLENCPNPNLLLKINQTI